MGSSAIVFKMSRSSRACLVRGRSVTQRQLLSVIDNSIHPFWSGNKPVEIDRQGSSKLQSRHISRFRLPLTVAVLVTGPEVGYFFLMLDESGRQRQEMVSALLAMLSQPPSYFDSAVTSTETISSALIPDGISAPAAHKSSVHKSPTHIVSL
jgi:hypothetical protein